MCLHKRTGAYKCFFFICKNTSANLTLLCRSFIQVFFFPPFFTETQLHLLLTDMHPHVSICTGLIFFPLPTLCLYHPDLLPSLRSFILLFSAIRKQQSFCNLSLYLLVSLHIASSLFQSYIVILVPLSVVVFRGTGSETSSLE